MSLTEKQIKQYQASAKKRGLDLRETDIMFLRGLALLVIKEEMEKVKKSHEQKPRK